MKVMKVLVRSDLSVFEESFEELAVILLEVPNEFNTEIITFLSNLRLLWGS